MTFDALKDVFGDPYDELLQSLKDVFGVMLLEGPKAAARRQ
jgi:hypothetical protein